MKYVLSLFLVCCSFYLAVSQTFIPERPWEALVYPELETIWYDVYYDASFVVDTTDGYNIFTKPSDVPDVIEDDYLYSVVYQRGIWESRIGTYISKRNLYTGEEIWRIRYGLTDSTRQEVARVMYINEDGDLEIFGQIKPDPYKVNVWTSGYSNFMHSKRIMDKESGEMLYNDHFEYNEEGYFPTAFSYFNRRAVFFKEGNDFRYFQRFKKSWGEYDVLSCLMNYRSKSSDLVIDTLDVKYNSGAATDFRETNPARLGENEYLVVETNKEENRLLFRYVDKHLNVKEEYYSTVIGESSFFCQLHQVSKDQQKFLFYNRYLPGNDSTSFRKRRDIIIFDRRANIIQRIELSSKYSNNVEVLDWNEETNAMKLLAVETYFSTEDNDYYIGLELINIDEHGIITKEKSWVPTDSLRYMNGIESQKIDDDKYLIKFNEASQYRDGTTIDVDNDAKAVGYMLVDASEFNLTSSIKEVKELAVKLFPNPTRTQINVIFDDSFTGDVILYNSIGYKISSTTIKGETDYRYDVSELLEGMYYIEFLSEKQERRTMKFVKM